MSTTFQVTIDCTDPDRLVPFWALALGYDVEPPPGGFQSWNAYWRSIGIPEDELAGSEDAHDSIVDPEGVGPRIWFQPVPEPKAVKNRLHLDLDVSGGRSVPLVVRQQRIDAEAARLVGAGARRVRALGAEGADYYGVVMADPEGNEFCLA